VLDRVGTDRDAAFRAIAEAATTLLKAKTAYVWVDEGGETLREGGSCWAGPELAGRSVRTGPVPRDASPAGAVLAAGRTDDAIVHHGVLDPGTALLTKPFTPTRSRAGWATSWAAEPRRVGRGRDQVRGLSSIMCPSGSRR
jgi:hypothetical protein